MTKKGFCQNRKIGKNAAVPVTLDILARFQHAFLDWKFGTEANSNLYSKCGSMRWGESTERDPDPRGKWSGRISRTGRAGVGEKEWMASRNTGCRLQGLVEPFNFRTRRGGRASRPSSSNVCVLEAQGDFSGAKAFRTTQKEKKKRRGKQAKRNNPFFLTLSRPAVAPPGGLRRRYRGTRSRRAYLEPIFRTMAQGEKPVRKPLTVPMPTPGWIGGIFFFFRTTRDAGPGSLNETAELLNPRSFRRSRRPARPPATRKTELPQGK